MPRLATAPLLLLLLAMLEAPAVQAAGPCRGRKVKTLEFKSCGADNVVQLSGTPQARLVEEGTHCLVGIVACVNITKPISNSTVSITLKKNRMTVYRSKDTDACAMSEQIPAMRMVVGGLDGKCSHQPGEVCVDESSRTDITAYAGMLTMAKGKWTISLRVKHDSGPTCYDITAIID